MRLHRKLAGWLLPAAAALCIVALPGPMAGAQQAPSHAVERSRGNLLDLNTATPAELKALPGMGAEYVRRIIAGRPYTAKNQLFSRGVLPQPAYERIAGLVVARRQRTLTR